MPKDKITSRPGLFGTTNHYDSKGRKIGESRPDYVYYSPVEADSFDGLPPAYIETAEFDCLHDDGILYAEKLREAGIPVTLNETKGTMHGFDIVQRAETTEMALKARIGFMKQAFGPY